MSTRPELGKRPASAKMLMADLTNLESELVVEPAGNQTAMAPGRIRRGSLEAQQRRDHALSEARELIHHVGRTDPKGERQKVPPTAPTDTATSRMRQERCGARWLGCAVKL